MIQDRLINHQLAQASALSIKELVAYMGAIQAQNPIMALWALGSRLPNCKQSDIMLSLERGDVLRTHVLRPTWHFVSREDIYDFIYLTAPSLKRVLLGYLKHLNVDQTIFQLALIHVQKLLESGLHYTREEINQHLAQKGLVFNSHDIAQIMLGAELDMIACSGSPKKHEQTYALLETRAVKPLAYHEDEILGKLALKYFQSHNPASLPDFIWWSGLTATKAKRAISLLGESHPLIKEGILLSDAQAEAYKQEAGLFNQANSQSQTLESQKGVRVHLLAAFDEYLIAYKNRDLILKKENFTSVITSNGIFKPFILLDGHIIGRWKSIKKKNMQQVSYELFEDQPKDVEDEIQNCILRYQEFSQI